MEDIWELGGFAESPDWQQMDLVKITNVALKYCQIKY